MQGKLKLNGNIMTEQYKNAIGSNLKPYDLLDASIRSKAIL
jgi:hypothetical protein